MTVSEQVSGHKTETLRDEYRSLGRQEECLTKYLVSQDKKDSLLPKQSQKIINEIHRIKTRRSEIEHTPFYEVEKKRKVRYTKKFSKINRDKKNVSLKEAV
ncbi:hypothetical protein MG296_10715 [Flavobacteriaceae bacterium TK19130]|nr:hypothetical protein [Thermobacterium salinum]